MYAFIGGATMGGQGEPVAGITAVDLDGPNLKIIGVTAASAINPMYLAMSTDRHVVYSAHAAKDGQLTAWTVDGAELSPLGPTQSSGGSVPCHLSIHPNGRYLLTANYSSGTIAVHPIQDDGVLGEASHVVQHHGKGPNAQRQDGPHPHMIITDPGTGPERGHVLAVDLGTDTIYRYHLDRLTGRLAEVDLVKLPPGTGPRHVAIRGDHAYVAGELASTLSVIDLTTSPPNVLATVPTHTTGGTEPSYPSAIRLSPDGRHGYILNRGPNTIATFAIDGPDVSLVATVDAGGDYPWDAVLTGDYLYVANQRTSALTAFHLDPTTGVPEPTGTTLDVPHPVCILPTKGASA